MNIPVVYFNRRKAESGGALVVILVLLVGMVVALEAVQSYTSSTHFSTARQSSFLRADAAAEAGVEVVVGRLTQWVKANGGYVPSIGDCDKAGIPGNATFPKIIAPITPPSDSKLADFTFSIPEVYPVLPDDTYITNTSSERYLDDLADRINLSENSPSSPLKYYFTWNGSQNAKSVPARSVTYKIIVTATPKVTTRTSGKPYTLERYVRCDKVSPFNWCTYRLGGANYSNSNTYIGPLYVAGNVAIKGPKFSDSFLYGGSLSYTTATWLGSGKDAQLKQTSLLSLIPNLANNLAVDSNGKRQSSFENDTTPDKAGDPAPADMFSTRELIEPPTNPLNDKTPAVIKEARIYNQADVRIKISVATVGSNRVATESVVRTDGTVISSTGNPWVTQLLAAVNTKTSQAWSNGKPVDPNAFVDRSRNSQAIVQVTDIDVGKLKTVMEANPSVFPTGIIYAWDDTGLTSGTRPLTGIRLWNAGEIPNGGLVVGTNDPVYLKGDFNSGAKLPANATVDSQPTTQPRSNTMGNSGTTTASDRVVSGYNIQPAGVFGDSITELSNNWVDANSATDTKIASSTTINLVEGWTSMNANNLREDDIYTDMNRANPLWIENWSGKRRTMSGEEFVGWHSKYGQNTMNVGGGGGWTGDITFDSRVSALKLNWGNVTIVRERIGRVSP